MVSTVALDVTVDYVVKGRRRHARAVALHEVREIVRVEVPVLEDAALVAWRRAGSAGASQSLNRAAPRWEGGEGMRYLRAHGGRLYQSLIRKTLEGCPLEGSEGWLRGEGRLGHHHWVEYPFLRNRQVSLPGTLYLREQTPFSEVVEDGRDGAIAWARRRAQAMAVIGGHLHLATRGPCILGEQTGLDGAFRGTVVEQDLPDVNQRIRLSPLRFRADRGEDALAYARALRDQGLGGPVANPVYSDYEILDRDALAAAWDDEAEVAQAAVRVVRGVLDGRSGGLLPPDAYLALADVGDAAARPLSDPGDRLALAGALRGLADVLADAEPRHLSVPVVRMARQAALRVEMFAPAPETLPSP